MGSFQTVRSVEGDTVDKICQRYLGQTADIAEQVLDTNRHIAALGPVLPANTELQLPMQPISAPQVAFINLWD